MRDNHDFCHWRAFPAFSVDSDELRLRWMAFRWAHQSSNWLHQPPCRRCARGFCGGHPHQPSTDAARQQTNKSINLPAGWLCFGAQQASGYRAPNMSQLPQKETVTTTTSLIGAATTHRSWRTSLAVPNIPRRRRRIITGEINGGTAFCHSMLCCVVFQCARRF